MKTVIIIAIFSIIMINPLAQAQDSTTQPDKIDLSSHDFENLRDPFWPVEHERTSETEKIVEGQIADLKARINWPPLPLRGITHAGGKRYFAIIEGAGVIEAGDIVTKEQDSLIYRWKIDRVSSAGITSTRLDVTEKVQN